MFKKVAVVLLLVSLFFACSKTPRIDLKASLFHLQIPKTATQEFFSRVKSVALDHNSNIYILDSDRVNVVKFSATGEFIKELLSYGWGDGFVNRPSSIQIVDTTLILHNLSSLQFFSLDGIFRKTVEIGGRCAISVASDGAILANRMGDRFQFNYCLELYDAGGKLQTTFRTPRSKWYKKSSVDFAFADFTRDGHIVYVPTLLDSVFLYDRSGRILKAGKIEPVRVNKKTEFVFHVEDMVVDQDGLYLLRANNDTTVEAVECKTIEKYDFQFNKVASFALPEPVTIGIDLEPWAPWYHKFAIRNEKFYLMVSKPIEHLVVYEPVTNSAKH
jgi:hypothetical protein